jgi:hypothetical protein
MFISVQGSTLDTSFKQLYEAEEKLKNIVASKFDAAVHSQDVASVERFFKIFPLLAMHTEGITRFSKYLAAQVGIEKYINNTIEEQICDLMVSI